MQSLSNATAKFEGLRGDLSWPWMTFQGHFHYYGRYFINNGVAIT